MTFAQLWALYAVENRPAQPQERPKEMGTLDDLRALAGRKPPTSGAAGVGALRNALESMRPA